MHPVCNKTLMQYCKTNVAKQFTFCLVYKVLCLGQIQYNTLLSTILHIFKHNDGCIMLWAWVILKDCSVSG